MISTIPRLCSPDTKDQHLSDDQPETVFPNPHPDLRWKHPQTVEHLELVPDVAGEPPEPRQLLRCGGISGCTRPAGHPGKHQRWTLKGRLEREWGDNGPEAA